MYNHTELKTLVEKAINSLSYNEEVIGLIEPVKYTLSIGGKRIRPVLALMSCNLFSDNIEDAILPSSGIEVFHNFTLVHDDIIDQAQLRRNLPTVHHKWNLNQAVLSGDVMVFIANECFLKTPKEVLSKAFRVYNNAAIEVCIGQQLDIDFEKSIIVSKSEYLRMIELKTAVLLAAAARIGAIIGGANDKNADLMYDFGRNLGLAFQIQDDILDTFGDARLFGKTPGGDIVSNKKTILLVRALETASGDQLKKLQRWLSLKEFETDEKIAAVTEIFNQLEIRQFTEELANSYINEAFSLLGKVSVDTCRKKELTLFASSLIGRTK
jgi:geranylgeranyl diphosphate synthase, type II